MLDSGFNVQNDRLMDATQNLILQAPPSADFTPHENIACICDMHTAVFLSSGGFSAIAKKPPGCIWLQVVVLCNQSRSMNLLRFVQMEFHNILRLQVPVASSVSFILSQT